MTKTARAPASSGPVPTLAAATDRQSKGPGRKTGAEGALAISQAPFIGAQDGEQLSARLAFIVQASPYSLRECRLKPSTGEANG